MISKIGKSTSFKVTLADVAKKSGVSVSTVSMALSDSSQINAKTKKLIRRNSDELGYCPPRLRTAKNTFNDLNSKITRFGLLIYGSSVEDEANFTLLHKLSKHSLSSGIRMEFASIENTVNLNDVIDRTFSYACKLDGLLLMGMANPELLIELHKKKIPCLVIGNFMGDIFQSSQSKHLVSSVKPDPVEGGLLAATNLINTGHRRIGFVCEYLSKGLFNDQFLAGFKLAHLNEKIPFYEELVYSEGKPYAGGAMAAKTFCKLTDPPTAFVIPDARTAASFIQEYRAKGGNIDKRNIIICSSPNLVKKYHLTEYPSIEVNSEQLAATSIYYLKYLVTQPPAGAIEINIPWIINSLTDSILI